MRCLASCQRRMSFERPKLPSDSTNGRQWERTWPSGSVISSKRPGCARWPKCSATAKLCPLVDERFMIWLGSTVAHPECSKGSDAAHAHRAPQAHAAHSFQDTLFVVQHK